VWSKIVCRFSILRVLMGKLVRIKSILDDCEVVPFLNHVCSSLFDFLARSLRWCLSIMEWRAADVVLLRISWLLESSGSSTAL
jgi:hypothetical protein